MVSESRLTLNLQYPNVAQVAYAMQGDRLSRAVVADLIDGSTPWAPPAGAYGLITASKPDGTFAVYDTLEDGSPAVVIDGSTVTLYLAEQVLADAGAVKMSVAFFTSAGARLTTFRWTEVVAPEAVLDRVVSGNYISVFTATMAEAAQIFDQIRSAYGAPRVAATAAAMTDHNLIYVYTGSESGYTAGHWYYWDGTAWADGGNYNSTALNTDTTLSVAGMAADAKATGDQVSDLKSAIGYESKVLSAYPDASGVIISSSSLWNCYCYKCSPGSYINKITLGEESQQLLYAFYAEEPDIGSVSYNNSRTGMGAGVVTAENIKVPNNAPWIAIRVAKSDRPTVILAALNNINLALLNRGAKYTVSDLNDLSDNAIHYISKSLAPGNFPEGYTVGYVITVIFNTTNKLQVFFGANGRSGVQRACVNGTWSSWELIGQEAASAASSSVLDIAISRLSPSGITDADSITDNSFVYVSANDVSNLPSGGAWYLWTANFDANNSMQLAYGASGVNPYIRAKVVGTWGAWERLGQEAATAAVAANVITSTIAMFPSVGCCGDSFTAGYLYNKTDSSWYDPDYAPNGEYPAIGYPAVMGRLYGIEVTAYARGGLTSTAYRTDSKGLPALLADEPKYLYIIALGLNDKTQNVPIGVEADIDTEPSTPTYLGNMGAIIRAIKAHAPYARIILCKSLWMATAYYNYISEGVTLLSSHLGIPYIETLGDPYFESSAYKDGLKGLHPTAPLYAGMGKRIGELVGKCVIDNPSYFYNFYVPNV